MRCYLEHGNDGNLSAAVQVNGQRADNLRVQVIDTEFKPEVASGGRRRSGTILRAILALLVGLGAIWAIHHETHHLAAPGNLAQPAAPKGSVSRSVAGVAPLAAGGGFWIAYTTGAVQAVGSAVWHGDMSAGHLNAPIVGIASTSDGRGYWLVAADGGIFGFGDARFYGSTGSTHLNSPVIAMASTADSRGYWLLGGDGGIFSFGDARFYGSTGSTQLNKPVEAMTPTPDGKGYWLVASDGGIFSFGDARFHGSTGSMHLGAPIVAMATTTDGLGYWLLGGNGAVFNFGDAPFRGSALGTNPGGSADGIVRAAGNGYWVLESSGAVLAYGAPAVPTHAPASPVAIGTNPPASVAPTAAFNAACLGGHSASVCNAVAIVNINSARQGEALGPIALPANYDALGLDAQSVAVANAERTSRGLPSLPENATLDALAQQGALNGKEPAGPANTAWGSNMSWGYLTPLAADFVWMYYDGIGSSNIYCTKTVVSGCWGHRNNILAPWSGAAGAGNFDNHGTMQLSQLFVEHY